MSSKVVEGLGAEVLDESIGLDEARTDVSRKRKHFSTFFCLLNAVFWQPVAGERETGKCRLGMAKGLAILQS
jgi:hypothetical protein